MPHAAAASRRPCGILDSRSGQARADGFNGIRSLQKETLAPGCSQLNARRTEDPSKCASGLEGASPHPRGIGRHDQWSSRERVRPARRPPRIMKLRLMSSYQQARLRLLALQKLGAWPAGWRTQVLGVGAVPFGLCVVAAALACVALAAATEWRAGKCCTSAPGRWLLIAWALGNRSFWIRPAARLGLGSALTTVPQPTLSASCGQYEV